MKHDQKESRRRFRPKAKANHISSWRSSMQTRREYGVAGDLNLWTFFRLVNDLRRKERHEKNALTGTYIFV